MYTLIVQNFKGEQLYLTGNDRYDIIEITGLNPSPASINTVTISGFDGSRFNSARIQQRNILISLNIRPPIEENRIELYRFFQTKRSIKLYYKNEHRDVYIEGYVESIENNFFTMLQQPQISIICPDPFFKSVMVMQTEFSNTVAMFEFPFSIPSAGIEFSEIEKLSTVTFDAGDIQTGIIIEFYAGAGSVINPEFKNNTTNASFKINFEMQINDRIIINTMPGRKSVTLYRSGISQSILSSRALSSNWVQLEQGLNDISYNADSGAGNLEVKVSAVRKFEGV